jgi:CRISPR system Cascade subunit CasA
LSPAEAIRAVLAAHCWDTAAIKSGAADDPQVKAGKTTGNQIGPLGAIGVVLPLGRTLAETILLHVPLSAGWDPRDRPQWRTAEQDRLVPASAWTTRHPWGLLDLLTWQARRIRLVPEQAADGSTVVRQVVLCAGDRIRTPQIEPHTAWRMSHMKEQVPVRHTAGQAAWRGMLPMLAASSNATAHGTSSPVLRHIRRLQHAEVLPQDYPLRVLTVGVVYGNQSAVIDDAVADLLPVPIAALDGDGDVYQLIEEIVEQADALRQAVNRLGDDLRTARGGDRVPWDKGQRPGDQMMHDLDRPARDALSSLQHAPDRVEEVRREWSAAARRIAQNRAESLLNSVPPQAFLGRVARNQHPQRASTAELWFRVAVAKILGTPPSEGTPAA